MIAVTNSLPEHLNPQLSANRQPYSFSKSLQNDERLFFYLQAMQEAFSLQLDRIEREYLYDEIEMGELFEKLYDRPIFISLDDAIQMLEIFSKITFFKERTIIYHKVCQGHVDDLIRDKIPNKEIDDVEKNTNLAWGQRPDLKSFSIRRVENSNLVSLGNLNKTFYLIADYTHVDNHQNCDAPSFKKLSIQERSFESVLDEFKDKISSSSTNSGQEWAALARLVFGERLNIV